MPECIYLPCDILDGALIGNGGFKVCSMLVQGELHVMADAAQAAVA